MCPSAQTVSQTKNGILTYCDHSKLFQLVYNNLCFELYDWELIAFKEYVFDIDPDYWEVQLKETMHNKRIPISIGTKHCIVVVNREELLELKQLLREKKKHTHLLSSQEIAYRHLQN
ncbi:MAG: hypothetical protein ED555_08485 [Allomuricauda sp.]|nr:MAG: hypothetical protein ED555_08485 [Allomuricauda sp.]